MNMKRILTLALGALLAVTAVYAQQSQDVKEQKALIKERRQVARLTKTELNKRVSRTTKDAMKTYKKQGWKVSVGALPLEKQLERVYNMQYEFETPEFPKYIMGEATAVGATYDAAKMQATELAKINLASQMQTEITALIESTVENHQISSVEATSMTESVMASKSLISQSIGRVIPVVECYRDTKTGMKEVRVQVAYSYKAAAEAAKKAMQAELDKKGEKLHDQIDSILGL